MDKGHGYLTARWGQLEAMDRALLQFDEKTVNAAPFDKGSRQEEMVTRCIVEVLSNALAKPNAPPIDPECQEILKKSNRHNQDEKDNELKKYEMNTNLDKRQHGSKEESKTDLSMEQNEEKRHHAESESKEEEEGVKEIEHSEEKEESTGHSKERAFAEDEEEEEDEKLDHKDHYEKEDAEKRNKYDNTHEAEHEVLDKKAHHTTKHPEESHGEDDEEEVKNLEDIVKRHPLNKIWKEQLFHPDKYHSVHAGEESKETDDHEEKRSYKPNHEVLEKLFNIEDKRNHQEEPRNNIASAERTSRLWGQNTHNEEPFMENHLIRDENDKRSPHEKESSEESREKRHHHRHSDEEREHNGSEESSETDLDNHHYEDKRQHEERNKWPSQQNSQLKYEESSEESEENIDKRHEHENSERENFYRKLRHHLLGGSEEEGPFRQDKKQDKKRHYIGKEMVDEMKRYYPEFSNDKDPRRYEDRKSQNYREDSEESNFPDNEMFKQNQAEEIKRASNKHGFYSDPLRWKSKYFDNIDDSEEDRKRSLQAKNIFPDYDDYDLWGKRQFLDDINREYGERRTPAKTHKYEEKRQYDRMDELAQLLNYKKKSVEFPDFYDSGEIKKRHYDERGRFNQRPLTEEEEKELENLALMDLELQKIAEKLSNNRQG
ncbi:secretogranin-1 [Gastrophryne carolinensis]